MDTSEIHNSNSLLEKWKKKNILFEKLFYNVKNLFPKNKLQYTYINTFLLCLFFTFIHKYLDQTLPSLYKSIENDFNIDVRTLYYMNTIYKLAYATCNFFFALFFDYSFKKISSLKCDNVNNAELNNNTHYEISFKNELEHKETSKLMGEMNIRMNEDKSPWLVGEMRKTVKEGEEEEAEEEEEKEEGKKKKKNKTKEEEIEEEEKLFDDKKYAENIPISNEEVTLGEYGYTLNVLFISSITYIIVIFGIMISNNFVYFFFFMFIMGINNACIYILIQKIYTNKVFSENRSTIFGFLHFFSSISHTLSISINTNLSNKLYLGFNGWRICYFIISFFPIFVCIYLLKLIKKNKLGKDRRKNNNLNYMVSFDNLEDLYEENFKGNNNYYYNKEGNDELLCFNLSNKENELGKEVSTFNIKQNISKNDTINEIQREKFTEVKKTYYNSSKLNKDGYMFRGNENDSYLNNMNRCTAMDNISTGDNYNSTSLISSSDKMNSSIIKRTINNLSFKRDRLKQYNKNDRVRCDAPTNSSDNNSKNCSNSYGNHHNSYNYGNIKEGVKNTFQNSTNNANDERSSGSIFTTQKDESDNFEQKDELSNLLERGGNEKGKKLKYEFSYLYEIKYVFKNYSFWLMITMGMLNAIPRHVLSLMIYFFQYCNISDFKSGFIMSSSWLCASLISPFIGIISDYIYKLNKDINRQLIGMSTHCCRIVLMFTLFFFIPKEADSFIYFVIISVFMGILSGWINIGTHKPIIIDIVKQRHTAFVMALMNAFENIGSSIVGTFFLSFLLNRYNYIDKKNIKGINTNVNKHNVHVLSDVLLILTCLPWLLSFCLLYVLKFTYKKDKMYNNII
ncbi:major facilitator superfamily domain-containing protein, putative [Plasmodium malariae]|uniref:Major facilitator superfamily domain-containing protein, putative n=1 Tax=Plasmodium malariae TaxID=5858 RepID=A0A1D3TCS3_PLAMA|nr:major facilitator superfamily domain-containing protein, putative [Plasmodium malariae]SCP02672.1 major facilitator superfamily domain-containing protein, putative [Plasmodium malariae]